MGRNTPHSESAATSEAAIAAVASRELWVPSEDVKAVRLAGDASSRRFFRVTYPGATAVAVEYPAPFDASETSSERLDSWCEARPDDGIVTFANDPICHVELTLLLAHYGVPVPAVLAVADHEGLIFVEDVGDTMLQGWLADAGAGERLEAYERAVDLLAQFRAATSAVSGAEMAAGRLAFDEAKLGWELEFFRANAFERYLASPLPDDLYTAVREEFARLAAELAARPRFLCHRDYHARNLMLRPNEPGPDGLVVIDYQDARLGPVTYDLVSILEDPYVPLDPEFRARLAARFADRLRAEGVWPGEDAFREEYDLMAVQRLLKAVGTYTHQAAVRGNRTYEPYIAPALAEARAVLDRLGRFPSLARATDYIIAETRGEGGSSHRPSPPQDDQP